MLFITYIVALSLVVGSFFNVVGLRIPKGEYITYPRSHCASCNTVLTVRDLVPVVSYVFLKGKCRRCEARISPIYPIFELLTAIGFIATYVKYDFTGETLIGVTLVSLLIIISVSDYHYMIIPDKILLFFLPIVIIERLFIPLSMWWNMFIGGAIGFLIVFILALVSRGGIGGGDIKLFGVLGLVLGTKLVLLAFFLSTLYASMFGAFLLLKGVYRKGKPIPFGPFIAVGAFTSFIFGNELIHWYRITFL